MGRLRAFCAIAGALMLSTGSAQAQDGTVQVQWQGLAQVQFNTTSLDEADTGAAAGEVVGSTFELRRIRIAAEARIDEWLRGKIETDAAMGRIRVTDAYLDFGIASGLGLRAGQFKKPFSLLELTSSSQVIAIERGVNIRELNPALGFAARDLPELAPPMFGSELLPGEHYQMLAALGYLGRDMGAMLHGSLGRFGLQAGVFNGAGQDRRDTNDAKSATARATFRPAPRLPLTLGGAVSYRETRFDGLIGGQQTAGTIEGTAFEVDAQWGGFRDPLRAQVELAVGDNLIPGTDLRSGQAIVSFLHALGGERVEGIEPLLRVSYGDPRTAIDGDEAWLLTPGVNLYFHARNRLMLNWDLYRPSDDRLPSASAFRAQAQLHF